MGDLGPDAAMSLANENPGNQSQQVQREITYVPILVQSVPV